LQYDANSDTCFILIQENTGNDFVLGGPFFRSYIIELDYNSTMINIYDKPSQSPEISAIYFSGLIA